MLVFTCRLLGGQRRFFKIASYASASYRPITGVIGVGRAASRRLTVLEQFHMAVGVISTRKRLFYYLSILFNTFTIIIAWILPKN